MPAQNLLDRYEAHRTRRFLKNQEQTAGWLTSWRTQSRRRLLVVILAVLLAGMFATAVTSYSVTVAAIAWLPLTAAFVVVWTSLQITSSRLSDAPRLALDEREIAERNSARSIGLTVAQILVMIPIVALLLGSGNDNIDHQNLCYAAGGFVLASILTSGCLPAMILGWIRPDDDPEDAL